MNKLAKILIVAAASILLCGCGHKNKNIFTYIDMNGNKGTSRWCSNPYAGEKLYCELDNGERIEVEVYEYE